MDFNQINDREGLFAAANEVINVPSDYEQARLYQDLMERASQLRLKGQVEDYYKKTVKAIANEVKTTAITNREVLGKISHNTEYEVDGTEYQNMKCDGWLCNWKGIYTPGVNGILVCACKYPILPVARLRNVETGDEQIKIAYFRDRRWKEIIVPKEVIASASKISQLAGQGFPITTENAKLIVKYLYDVECLNEDKIPEKLSTSKLGWQGLDGGYIFIPYDERIIFDSGSRFRDIYKSVHTEGSYQTWFEHICEIRKSGRIEPKIILAASFASPIVQTVKGLPFFVDLWGETEGGKTVTLMLAASVWANPDDSQYIGDFKTTDVALEARADFLNHLPVILDDTSKASDRVRNNFEATIYDLCSGKGKSRSNKQLGMNRENHWRNCFLVNGERPLSSYTNQGGAVNRIIEVQCGDRIYTDPRQTAYILKHNYGHAGRIWIDLLLNEIGKDAIRSKQTEYYNALLNKPNVMQKQAQAMAIILTADYYTEKYIFKDGCTITVHEASKLLADYAEVSENERAYRYVMDIVASRITNFTDDKRDYVKETWGRLEDDYAIFIPTILDDICKRGGYSKKGLIEWAKKKGLLRTDSQGKPTITTRISDDVRQRCVWIKRGYGDDDQDGFYQVDDNPFE